MPVLRWLGLLLMGVASVQSQFLNKAGEYTIENLDRTDLKTFNPHQQTVNKFVLHTIEGLWPANGDWELGIRVLDTKTVWPHFILALDKQGVVRLGQFLPLNVYGTALRGTANREGAIQIEIGGKANDPFTKHEAIRTAVKALYKALMVAIPTIPNRCDPFVIWSSSSAATETSAQRIDQRSWIEVAGLVGHQHAYDNDHWDPGAIDCFSLLDGPNTPTPAHEPWGRPTQSGCAAKNGVCMDKTACTNGTPLTGLCPGASSNQCCVASAGEKLPLPGVGTPCFFQANQGVCLEVTTCTGVTHAGLCPGPSAVVCCMGAVLPATTTKCKVTGMEGEGVCIPTAECSERGANSELVGSSISYPGFCPGAADVQCCIENHGLPVDPDLAHIGTLCTPSVPPGPGAVSSCQFSQNCSGTSEVGKCPGSALVRCCTLAPLVPPTPTPVAPSPTPAVKPTLCAAVNGACQDISTCGACHTAKPGLCPGAASMQCCIPVVGCTPPPTPTPISISIEESGAQCLSLSLASLLLLLISLLLHNR